MSPIVKLPAAAALLAALVVPAQANQFEFKAAPQTDLNRIYRIDRVTGEDTSRFIRWERDAAIEAIVASWPARFAADRAEGLGLASESSFDDIVRAYREDLAAAA